MWNDIRIGLKRPSMDEQLKVQGDCNAMRQAIEEGQHDSSLIRSCLMQAQFAGLSGEDKYVLLAYHALLMLEDHAKRNLEMLRLMPSAGIVIKDTPAGTTE